MNDYRFQNTEYAIFAAGFMGLCTVLGIFILAPMFPPTGQPGADAETIMAFYQDGNLMKRIGLSVMMFGTPFIVPMFALLGEIIKRDIGMPLVGTLQYGMGMFGILFTFMMTVCWGTAAFRPDRAAEITTALHDMGWLFATWVASATILQSTCICIAVFMDKREEPLFPRWFGYFTAWTIILGLPAAVINIFNSGPFAYDGLLGFWIPYIALFAWGGVMLTCVWKAVKKLQQTSSEGDTSDELQYPSETAQAYSR